MLEFQTHCLKGCTTTPLAGYLKALGLLRLLSTAENNAKGEPADAKARGWWSNEYFFVRTGFDRDALLQFFLKDYAPSPIIGPWNGRAGFLEGDSGTESTRTGAQLMKAIETTSAHRFRNMREVIAALRRDPVLSRYDALRAQLKALAEQEKKAAGGAKQTLTEKKKALAKLADRTKSTLLPSLRAAADERHLAFIDACFVLADQESAAPLLGSGGNDGSRDFGVNFAEALAGLLDFNTGSAAPAARTELEASIFSRVSLLDEVGTIGQFGPGQGGVNASTGFEGSNAFSRWDIIFALEGAVLWSGALTRRYGVETTGRAAFPFTFDPSGAGAGGLSSEDPNAPRGEVWAPLWSKPASLSEVQSLFAEGRVTLGRRVARTGLDAARAIARLGVSRGIVGFERYMLIQPDAKMPYQATPLGHFHTPDQPRRDLIADLDTGSWLARIRRLARERAAPARARLALRRFEDALFDVTRENRQRSGAQNALEALGGVVSWLVTNPGGRERLPPPPRLGRNWLSIADDGGPEFRIAVALASLGWPYDDGRFDPEEQETSEHTAYELSETTSAEQSDTIAQIDQSERNQPKRVPRPPPMAAHLAPVEEETVARRFRKWTENNGAAVVWAGGRLVENMIAVLERRLMEHPMRGFIDKPLAGPAPARLSDVMSFLVGPPLFDDARCAALVSGLVWATPTLLYPGQHQAPVPFAYAALKPLFTPDAILREIGILSQDDSLPIPSGMVAWLRRGSVEQTVRAALDRARASGIGSAFNPISSAAAHRRFLSHIDHARLAASLLIPIEADGLRQLIERVYPESLPREDKNDAA
jgi:CRISPR-associated protein Csx17